MSGPAHLAPCGPGFQASDPFWGGESWFCGFSVSFLILQGREEGKKEAKRDNWARNETAERGKRVSARGDPLLFSPPFSVWSLKEMVKQCFNHRARQKPQSILTTEQ